MTRGRRVLRLRAPDRRSSRLTPLDPEPISAAMQRAASVAGVEGRTMVLPPRNYGTRVDVSA